MPNDRNEVAKSMISMVDILDRGADPLRNVGSDGLSTAATYMLSIVGVDNSGIRQMIIANIGEILWVPWSPLLPGSPPISA
jgi:hypothetical protein